MKRAQLEAIYRQAMQDLRNPEWQAGLVRELDELLGQDAGRGSRKIQLYGIALAFARVQTGQASQQEYEAATLGLGEVLLDKQGCGIVANALVLALAQVEAKEQKQK